MYYTPAVLLVPPFTQLFGGLLPSSYSQTNSNPRVELPYSTFEGITIGNVTQFLGIPFAEPPIQDLRFRRPHPPLRKVELQPASKYGAACPQQAEAPLPGINFTGDYASISEDCLTINILKPAMYEGAKLPVHFWIHGGGFEIGDASDSDFSAVIVRSMAISQPIIVVTADYRLNGLGFLAGSEVERENVSNLGLHDQRFALQWVQDHIEAFGGDPNKVIISGISAGGISVGMHLVARNGSPQSLFHGAFMESGTIYSTPSVASGQPAYDHLVNFTNCYGTRKTLECLRHVPLDTIMAAVNQTRNVFSYSSLHNEWKPRVDGDLLVQHPLCAVEKELYVKVPLIAGNCDDEGTLFSLSNMNVTTDDQFSNYIKSQYVDGATDVQMKGILASYPQDPDRGSPFGTGNANALTPEYKRLAAIQGDIVFQAPRRLLLGRTSRTQDTWGFLYKRGKHASSLGASHGSDLKVWLARNTTEFIAVDALIHFVNSLDPNPPVTVTNNFTLWPKWGASNVPLLTFSDLEVIEITHDDYRFAAIDLLNRVQIDLATREGLC